MTGGPRRIASALCGALGVMLIFAAFLLGYATRSLFNERAFAAHVAASLEDPRFAGFVAERIADAVIKAKPDLVGVRPVVVSVARSVVASPPFRAAVRRSARTMHHAVMSGTGASIVLGVQDLGVLLESMADTHPALARKIPAGLTALLGRLDSIPGGELSARLVRLANRMRASTLGLLLLGIALSAGSVWLSDFRRRAIVRIGVALTALGLMLGILARFGGPGLGLFARHTESVPAIVALAGAFLVGLLLWAAALTFMGLVLAAASASLLEQVQLQRWADQARLWLTGPQELMRVRLARGAVGVAIGVALLFWPLACLTVIAAIAGLAILFAGLREAFVAALHLLPEIEATVRSTERKGAAWGGAVAMVSGLALALLAPAAWVILRASAAPPAQQEIAACNGSAALCDRRLDQVVFPTTHNSMGSADVADWMFPSQNAGIRRQLEDGIRAFLIDIHYGTPVGNRVKTELEDEKAAMAKYERALGKEGMAAVLRIRDRMGAEKEQGERGVYLCHGFCELGALELVPALREVRDFLVANPGEVLILVFQDESVTPQDVERCFEESGLIEFVYRGPARRPWSTLRDMVASDQRVLVLAENQATGVDWYHPAFEVLQETPYGFRDPSEFSNRPNRGGTGGSLLLMNHWIESTPMPKPSNAAIVNEHDALLARIRAFRRERGRYPNLVAVDFYDVGDLVPVVRELNAR